MQGNRVVFEEHPYIDDRNGKRTGLVVQGNVYCLRARVLNGTMDGQLLCAMGDVEVRALKDRAERETCETDEHPRRDDACRNSWAKRQGSTLFRNVGS